MQRSQIESYCSYGGQSQPVYVGEAFARAPSVTATSKRGPANAAV